MEINATGSFLATQGSPREAFERGCVSNMAWACHLLVSSPLRTTTAGSWDCSTCWLGSYASLVVALATATTAMKNEVDRCLLDRGRAAVKLAEVHPFVAWGLRMTWSSEDDLLFTDQT